MTDRPAPAPGWQALEFAACVAAVDAAELEHVTVTSRAV